MFPKCFFSHFIYPTSKANKSRIQNFPWVSDITSDSKNIYFHNGKEEKDAGDLACKKKRYTFPCHILFR